MKSLIRWSTTVGLVGTTLVGSLWLGAVKALALTPDQIMSKLREVPVFTIANAQGAPLVASPSKGQKGPAVAGVFINQKDAQNFLDGLKSKNPKLAEGVKVMPVSLAEIYKLDQANQGKPEELDFAYVPSQQQVASAVEVLKQSGQQAQQFNGTPLFFARSSKEGGYLTIQQGDKSMIPIFFKKEDLQGLVDRFKQQQPNLASSIQIQVLNLEGLLDLLKSKNDEQLNQIVLVPPRESVEYVRSVMGAPKPAAQPKK